MSVEIESVHSTHCCNSWAIASKIKTARGRKYLAQADLSVMIADSSFLIFHGLERHPVAKYLDRPIYYFNRLIVPEPIRCFGVGTNLIEKIEICSDKPVYNPINYYGFRKNIKTGKEDDSGEWYKDWLESRGWFLSKSRSFAIWMPKERVL
jgi:hypothetical protein